MFDCIYRQCNENFPNVEELKNHCVKNHRKESLKWYHCPVEPCDFMSKIRSAVYKHLRTNHADHEDVEKSRSDSTAREIEKDDPNRAEVEGNIENVEVEEVDRNHSDRERNDSNVEVEESGSDDTALNVTPNVSKHRSRRVSTPVREAVIAPDDNNNNKDSLPREIRNLKLGDFDIGKPLGKGIFGKVYLAREKEHQLFVALKIMFKSQLLKLKMDIYVVREITIQCHLRHPNILRLYNYFFDKKKIFMVLEYALHGELYKILQKMRRFCEARTAWYIFQVADALHYCHSKNIIHRDLKPENILVSADGSLKLADFGTSVHSDKKRGTFTGTLVYSSPEMVTGKPHDYRTDNWAVGVLCYEFLEGETPFEFEEKNTTRWKIMKVEYDYTKRFTEGSKDLISKLLVATPSKRLSLDGVMDHHWVKEQLELARHINFTVF